MVRPWPTIFTRPHKALFESKFRRHTCKLKFFMKVSDKMVSDSLPIVPKRDFVILGDYEYGFGGIIGF